MATLYQLRKACGVEQLTPLVGELQPSILPPVGVAEVAQSAVVMRRAPVEPPVGCDSVTALAPFLSVRCHAHRFTDVVGDHLGHRTRRHCLT